MAVRLIFGMFENPSLPCDILGGVFDQDYYATLKDEDSLYSSAPDAVQAEYIAGLVTGVFDHAAELDSYIEKYAVNWKFGRMSRTAL